jgi:hypothetical protein
LTKGFPRFCDNLSARQNPGISENIAVAFHLKVRLINLGRFGGSHGFTVSAVAGAKMANLKSQRNLALAFTASSPSWTSPHGWQFFVPKDFSIRLFRWLFVDRNRL